MSKSKRNNAPMTAQEKRAHKQARKERKQARGRVWECIA